VSGLGWVRVSGRGKGVVGVRGMRVGWVAGVGRGDVKRGRDTWANMP